MVGSVTRRASGGVFVGTRVTTGRAPGTGCLLSGFVRLAVAATAGLAAAAMTTSSAISQEGSRAAEPVSSAAPIARALPHEVIVADLSTLVEARSHDVGKIDDDTRCLAKVVHHEAGNQSLKGQLAVAEVIVNRTRSQRFPTTYCAVANQRGQFFHTARYSVAEDSARWRTAVAVARLAQSSGAPHVVPGALFFHAAYVHPGWRRKLLVRIGDQVFYR